MFVLLFGFLFRGNNITITWLRSPPPYHPLPPSTPPPPAPPGTVIQCRVIYGGLLDTTDNTEMILITPAHTLKAQFGPSSFQVNGFEICTFVCFCPSLRCPFWSHFPARLSHTIICQACCLELSQIRVIRHYLTHDSLKTLIYSSGLSLESCWLL